MSLSVPVYALKVTGVTLVWVAVCISCLLEIFIIHQVPTHAVFGIFTAWNVLVASSLAAVMGSGCADYYQASPITLHPMMLLVFAVSQYVGFWAMIVYHSAEIGSGLLLTLYMLLSPAMFGIVYYITSSITIYRDSLKKSEEMVDISTPTPV